MDLHLRSTRWKCNKLNPIDCMYRKQEINFSLSPALITDVENEYLTFKIKKIKSKLLPRKPSPHKEVIANSKPVQKTTFNISDLPNPEYHSPFRYKNSKKSETPTPFTDKEIYIEDLIKNRNPIHLPNIEISKKIHYRNIRDRFMRTKSLLSKPDSDHCETILDSLRSGILDKSYKEEKEAMSWQLKPLRLWKGREKHFHSPQKSKQLICSVEESKEASLEKQINLSKNKILRELDACRDDVVDWFDKRINPE
ncbi:unnamed protein product [Blepharisma stoltei]|uniref:Uncharacterized protein n=1 Tax=Blepharisma stoltei TaxID=1481888 RepID=A0AAU9J079_9CILI|nr:unnamed protein product [Blepharisma stoltei]